MSTQYEQGIYHAEITEQALGQSSKGTPQFCLKIKPLEMEDPRGGSGARISVNGNERTVYLYMSEAAIVNTADQLARLGYPHDTTDQLDPKHPQCHSFVGQKVRVKCKHEEYEGDWSEKWGLWLPFPPKPLDVKPLDQRNKTVLNALFGRAKKTASAGQASKPKTKPTSTPKSHANAIAGAMPTDGGDEPEPVFADNQAVDDDVPF